MVYNQLVPNGVTDKNIIDAMLKVFRHKFVDNKWRDVAYVDSILPIRDTQTFIDDNRYLMTPMVFAKMLQAGEINSNSTVLDVGVNSGYSSIIISTIAQNVVAIDVDRRILKTALGHVLLMHAEKKIEFYVTMEFKHNSDGARFDLIFVNGILNQIPEFLKSRLLENGRLTLIEKKNHLAQAVKYVKHRGNLIREVLFNVDADYRLNVYMDLNGSLV